MSAEGLRAVKKRQMRQRISDVATELFLDRGFDSVTVGEVAAAVGVSEKTVFNYFPSKEALVLDQLEGQIERLVGAVRDRAKGVTPTAAWVAALKEDSRRFHRVMPDEQLRIEEFSRMMRGTPALRAAWSEHRHQMVAALAQLLADELQVDCGDPEPLVAGRALVGLVELLYDSRLRHAARPGVSSEELMELIAADLDRGARLLDTGLWALHLMIEGRRTKDQILEAAARAERGRQQVHQALREAKRLWREVAREAREQARLAEQRAREQARLAEQRGRCG